MGKISRNGKDEINDIQMPKVTVDARTTPISIDELILNYENFLEGDHKLYPWADKFVMGYPLPPWQRGFVWTELQQERFITSIWKKLDLGSYLVNNYKMSSGHDFDLYSNILQDGQQRLTTLELYLTDKLAVDDIEGKPQIWSELSKREQRRFGGSVFAKCQTDLWDEKTLREVYDLRNFSGTAHLESERALPKDALAPVKKRKR